MEVDELEDRSALRGFRGMVEIGPIEHPNERSAERYASRDGRKDVAKELNSLFRVQLSGTQFFFAAPHRDGRAARSAQIAHPVDGAPG